jgi:hypothetical protein
MGQQTAVDWLHEVYNQQGRILTAQFEQAKQMEKEQHDNTWVDSRIEYNGDDYIGQGKTFEQYYNETYGQ